MNEGTTHSADRTPRSAPEQEKSNPLSAHVSGGKGRNTLHGNSYHLRLGLVMMLRGFRMYQQDRGFNFVIAMEDPAGKDFDDIMYHYSFGDLSTGSVCIQAKHKRNEHDVKQQEHDKSLILTEGTLYAPWDGKNSSFSIAKYFLSYLEVEQYLQTHTRTYVLCSNGVLDKKLKGQFIEREQQPSEDVLQFCYDIGARCYQINHLHTDKGLKEQLINSSLAKLGKLMANDIFRGKKLIFKNSLYHTFAGLINECVEPSQQLVAEESTFKFKDIFFDEPATTPMGTLQIELQKEYKKLKNVKEDVTESLKSASIQIDQRSFLTALSNTDSLDQNIEMFYKSFVLVCQTPNDEELYSNAIELLPSWADPDVVLDKLQSLLFDAMKSVTPIPIDLKFLQKLFTQIDPNADITILKSKSREYLASLKQCYPHIAVEEEPLKASKLNEFVVGEDGTGLFEFSSTLDLNVSSCVVNQTLLLHKYDPLFIDYAKYQEKKEMLNILNDLLSYLRDVKHPTIKVIIILGKPEVECLSEIMKLCEHYHQRIVVLAQTSRNVEFAMFFVRDLTNEAKENLFHEYGEEIIFETVTPLRTIIHDDDDMAFLLNVLKLCQQPKQLERNSSIEQHYQKIEPWYVHRQFVPFNSPKGKDNFEKMYISFGETIANRENVLISDVAHDIFRSYSDILSELKLSNEEIQNPPGLLEDENNSKVCIFLNEAGEGKTTYFTWLAWSLSKYDRSWYVIKLIALEYVTDFEQLEENGIDHWDETQLMRFLYRLIHLALFVRRECKFNIEESDRTEADRCAEALSLSNGLIELDNTKTKELKPEQVIEIRLFREKFNSQKLMLILDGFDEIAPYYEDVVMKCFVQISRLKGIRKMYLSSRPYDLEEVLKKAFPNCQTYRLKILSGPDVLRFLHKRLALNVEDYIHCEVDHQDNFLKVLYAVVTDVLADSVTSPLLLYLGLDTLLPGIKEHVNFKTNTISTRFLVNSKLDILQLVEAFIKKNLQILHTDKSATTSVFLSAPAAKGMIERENRRIKELHIVLAMHALFDIGDRKQLLSSEELNRINEWLKEVEDAEEKTGIISGVHDGRPQFVHRMFAEYFVAYWLYQNVARFKQERVFQSQAIWNRSMEKVVEFFNRMVLRESERCELHLAVLNKKAGLIKELISNNPSALTVEDKFGRTPFHIDFSRKTGLHNWSLNKPPHETVDNRDVLFGWNVLDYAFVLNDFYAVHDFRINNAEVKVDILMQQLSSNDTIILYQQGIKYVECLHTNGFLKIADEISARVVGLLINERKLDIFTPHSKLDDQSVVEHCALREDGCMLVQFVEQIGKPLSEALLVGAGDRMLQKAFERRTYKVVKCLIELCNIPLPPTIDTQMLYNAVRDSILSNDFLLFKTLFQQLCRQRNVECTRDIEEEVGEPMEINFEIDLERKCCVWMRLNLKLQLPEYKMYDIDETYVMEFLLATAVHTGNVKIVSYIHRNTKMTVTNERIVTILWSLPTQQVHEIDATQTPTSHKRSIPAFQYLLNQTVDLRSVDEFGRNLFHMTAQNGCAFMLPCLIAKGFDPTEINPQNNWNGLHYLISSHKCSAPERGLHLFKWLQPFFVLSRDRKTICEGALDFALTESTEFAHFICQTLYHSSSETVKRGALSKLVNRMLPRYKKKKILDDLLKARKATSVDGKLPHAMWFKVYDDFMNRIPIV